MLRFLLRSATASWVAGKKFPPIDLRSLNDLAGKALVSSSSSPDLGVSYLVNRCGLSQGGALSVANKINFKTTANADSVLDLLSAYGFTTRDIASVITKHPRLLFSDAEHNIKPKLEYFRGVGMSTDELVKFITTAPTLLKNSLEKRLRPNLQILQEHGVPPVRIARFVILAPKVLHENPAQFLKSVVSLKEMGLDPSTSYFVHGLKALCLLNNTTWQRRIELYQSLGWSKEETIYAFKKFPICMSISDEKIKRIICVLSEKLNCTPSFIASHPRLLCCSVENTIVPRHNVMNILASNGLETKKMSITTILRLSKRDFFEKFIVKHQDQAPEILEAYKTGKENVKSEGNASFIKGSNCPSFD